MDVKIAVASSDGVTVDQHFGRARSFRIYRLHDSGYEFLENRDNETACSGGTHDDNALEAAATRISDCRGVVVAQIGAGAIDALIMHRILPFTLPGTVEEAFETLIKSKRFVAIKKFP
ncbi:MAG: NifB/NifX family molybdenum-iron cluster-binding protein [Desulfuromonadaceae bacterium]